MHYFDHNASTPIAPEVLRVLAEMQGEVFGNPSSVHSAGQAARKHLEAARGQVAARLKCQPKEVVFTSGGTESDNLAILGAPAGHVITTAIEHPAVLTACRQRGNCTVLEVGGRGAVDPEAVRAALRPDTVLVSVMHANNETGVVQPLAAIAAITKEAGVLLHSDGVQAACKIGTDMGALGVDLYSITAHKFGGPKGAGALFVRDGVKLEPRQVGGKHERERRAGTENVPGLVALGAAAALPMPELGPLRDRLERTILDRIADCVVNGAGAERTPNTANICFRGIEGEALLIALDLAGFAVSSGAACSSGAVHPSHVLTAMGMSAADARSSLRLSLGRTTTEEAVDALIETLTAAVARLRKLAPSHG